ncbi:DUF488 domain-containing protein [Fructilactobacillus carniphilus]|uniref:DUF488 family protein n=1 Tax=Fructilactobacillus carniphilus TaxID=2940297 RepID=A0ABY5BVK4_9LACO|nr:DUF488 family protein [Fructilactobacillus carniphilus]USS90534.1 DUF488 family protein [Fructilactobacillus carniphilus]
MQLTIERIYTKPVDHDGYRILVDRRWPRGISKVNAALDEWAKEIAPTTELRQWFNHIPERFPEFQQRYRQELDHNPATAAFVTKVAAQLETSNVILLYGAKDQQHNQAVVLLDYLHHQPAIQSVLQSKE